MTTVNVSGPIFNHLADHEAAQLTADVNQQVSQQAYANWMGFLDSSIRHPTPYYETQVNIHEENPTHRVVNDRGIIYGPWLEGVGSRNKSTRFKGYFSLRRAVSATTARIPALIERVARPFVERMNRG